jgi:diguanylate cyclase (GGDEF)-like protein
MTGTVGTLLALAGLALGTGLGWILSLRVFSRRLREQRRALEQAQSEARTDPLTGLANRKAFEEQLSLLTAIARRYGGPMALMLFDVDGLKQVNDSQGHAAGDAALVHFASVLRGAPRESDLAARVGGDEFAVLLPQTDSRGAGVLAERVRQALQTAPCRWPQDVASSPGAEKLNTPPAGALVFRASAGIAEWHSGDTPAQLLERADQALYRAKQSGGSRGAAGHRSSDNSTR